MGLAEDREAIEAAAVEVVEVDLATEGDEAVVVAADEEEEEVEDKEELGVEVELEVEVAVDVEVVAGEAVQRSGVLNVTKV